MTERQDSSDRWAEIEPLFVQAIELAPDAREAFIAGIADEQLRLHVQSLVAHHVPEGDTFIASAIGRVADRWVASTDAADTASIGAGRRIGAYEVTGTLGQGGMGTVYRARRVDGEFEHEVAIKLVRHGFETPVALERFRRERQILARLAHPAIATLVDGGTIVDESGTETPYLVLELIQGDPITTYCVARDVPLRERLALFRTVCDAVSHAHQQLVVHRDLKPSNILVTSAGQPKLLDFGIAKLLHDDTTEPVTQTATGMGWLTPDYASPEQVRGDPVTAATDVYSLGTILYELLTGQKAHRFQSPSPAEIARVICDAEATRPSAAVARTLPRATRLVRQLKGDLDTIVLMALRKDPRRRYSSVEQLSDDIGRYLHELPVRARPDTLRYRGRKFVVRHRVGVAAAVVVVATLTAGVIVTNSEARARAAEAARAERRFQQVRQLASTLLFDVHDHLLKVPGATAARELIAQTAQRYLRGLAAEAEGDPSLQQELAEAYLKLGDVQFNARQASLGNAGAALASYKEALTLTQALVAREPGRADYWRALAETYLRMGPILLTSGDSGSRVELAREGLRAAESAVALNRTDEGTRLTLIAAYEALGSALIPTRNLPAVLDNFRRGLEAAEALYAERAGTRVTRALARAHENVGEVSSQMGDLIPAVEHARASVKLLQALVAVNPADWSHRRDLMSVQIGLGDVLGSPVEFSLGQTAAAEAEYRKALEIAEALVAADVNDAQAQLQVATLCRKLGNVLATTDPARSADLHRRAITIVEVLRATAPRNITYRRQQALNHLWLAEPLPALRQSDAAFASVRRALAMQREILAEDPKRQTVRQDMLATLNALGDLQLDSGDARGAFTSYGEALAIAETVLAAAPADEWARRDRIDCYERLGRYWTRDANRSGLTAASRLEAWREARKWHQKSLGEWHEWTGLSKSNIYVQRRYAQSVKAVAAADSAIATLTSSLAPSGLH